MLYQGTVGLEQVIPLVVRSAPRLDRSGRKKKFYGHAPQRRIRIGAGTSATPNLSDITQSALRHIEDADEISHDNARRLVRRSEAFECLGGRNGRRHALLRHLRMRNSSLAARYSPPCEPAVAADELIRSSSARPMSGSLPTFLYPWLVSSGRFNTQESLLCLLALVRCRAIPSGGLISRVCNSLNCTTRKSRSRSNGQPARIGASPPVK